MTTLTAVLLGAFHGLNPAMGWLFAVARGLQERDQGVVLASLPAIAAGHLASVAVVALAVGLTGSLVTATALTVLGGVVLVGFGLWRLLSDRHFRWVGMRLSHPQLAAWSFLMSSAHGAGLMLIPLFTGLHAEGRSLRGGVEVAALHTLAMFAVAGAIAIVVYRVAGLTVLRRAWFNVDRMWALALVVAGGLTLAQA
ncbi:hypothetical protein [Sphaerisporangium aureirubrum]|uniref:Lysine transporter LysE n=1 Tax=Sphaerisporangium aureirubrum TaxID=1544736 RepID=A0ABW1NKH6_9ACTN